VSAIPSRRPGALHRRLAFPTLAAVLTVAAVACSRDAASARLYTSDPAAARWVRDSLLLDTRPNILFRVLPDGSGSLVVPIATVGPEGIRTLQLSDPGWRRVDAEHLHAGRTLHAFREGREVASVRMFRGMWQPGVPALDSLRCSPVIPMARAFADAGNGAQGVHLAASGERPPVAHEPSLDEATIATLLGRIGTLVAPTVGISPTQLPRYQRRVTQVPTGINRGSTLVLEYNDPTPSPREPKVYGERPRQLIVVLDRGAYDYRPTFTYSTTGVPQSPPRLRLLDYLDTDADGVPELFFGPQESGPAALYTLVLRYESEAWREVFQFTGNRCNT
jgi:hypothetical protein